MSIVRSLESFSLAELFKSIENESRSGRLIIETPISQATAKRDGIYYLWFKQGYLIAISDCLNHKGLINLIEARGWISPVVISRLRTLCPATEPLGVYLRRMKLLSKEKLSFAFQLQLHQVYRLFQLTTGRLRFDDFSELEDRILTVPWLEMTGHQIKTTEVVMHALRLMDDWKTFGGQLPEPSTILRPIVEQPHLKLTSIERNVWEFVDGKISLVAISRLTEQPLITIQMTAFRIIAVGLVDDIFQSEYDWERPEYEHARQNNQPNYDSLKLAKSPHRRISLLKNLGELFQKRIPES